MTNIATQAFRSSGNNDLASNLQVSNREALLLPDKITPYDNMELPPPPDASWLLSQVEDVTATPIGRKGRASNRDINLQEDFDNSQYLRTNNGMDDDALAPMADLDLELDFGLDIDGGPSESIEMGRNAPMGMGVEDDVFSEVDMATTLKAGPDMPSALDFGDDIRIADNEGDLLMGDDDINFHMGDGSAMPDMSAVGQINRARISESPLSDVDEDLVNDGATSFATIGRDLYEPLEDVEATIVRRPAQRARKQKILMPDSEIALSSTHIKQQQADRHNITKEATFLPRDPVMLALMDMQRSGGFVSSIMAGGRSSAWAPELRDMLSLNALRGDLKRKRDSGVADLGEAKSPRLDLGDDADLGFDGNGIANQSFGPDGTILEIPADDGLFGDDGGDREGSPMPNFDETTMPIVHPADSGPVSLGTKHAVHVLRDLFGSEAATNDEKRLTSAVVFQDLLPEKETTKAEATKMFFECLVLATKDAIKVEQGADLGDPIRVRGKRGLWGDWAEREAGGEIANQNDADAVPLAAQPVAVGA